MDEARLAMRCRIKKRECIEKGLRVDHAGEYAAIRIYSGQMLILGRTPELVEMWWQELGHYEYFNRLMADMGIRPTVFMPLWRVMSVMLGIITACIGREAAMACTVAVEDTIGRHYDAQVDIFREDVVGRNLVEKICIIRDEELEHHDIALLHGAKFSPVYELLSAVIKQGCKIAIALSELL